MVANPSLRTIARLADVLGISVNTLLQESTPRQNSR
jgi:transcriptional regulator with XRE-family HTH domain